MQQGVLVCVLLLACHSRQGDSSASSPESDAGERGARTEPGTPLLHKNNTTPHPPPPPTALFASSSSTTHSPPPTSAPTPRNTASAAPTPAKSPSSATPPPSASRKSQAPLPSTTSPSNFSHPTFSTFNESRLESTPLETTSALYFDKPHRNRTLAAVRRVNKTLKFINRVKSVSTSANASKGGVIKAEDATTLEGYKSLVYPTKGLTTTLNPTERPKVVRGKKPHASQVTQVENLRLSLGDTSEIHVGHDVIRSDAEFRHQSDVNKARVVVNRVIAGNDTASQSTARNSEVMSPPPSHVDVSKHTSPIADVNDAERRQNRTEKNWPAPQGGVVSESVHGSRDDYYEYSEYSDFPMKHFNISGFREAAVIPDPDLRDDEAGDAMVESEPEIILPDDSLADTDLHDHDLIDSVMYIYFGGSREDGRGAGRQVLIVGAVIGLVAQFLSLASAVQRVRSFPREETTVILLHTQLAFTVSNLVFMLGVQATSTAGQCARVALALHYLHMTAGIWLLVNCAHVCLRISVKLRHAIAAWCLPLFYVLGCFILNRRIYETRNFCWMSIHRGLLLSFVAPAFIFLTANTTLGAIGYTRSKFQCQQSPSVDRKALRVAVVLLPAFIFDWFVEIVALEKSSALVFPLLFVASKAFINWFIFACWLPSDQSWMDLDDEYDEDFDDLEDEMAPALVKLKYMADAEAQAHAHEHKGMDEYRLPYYHYPGYPGDDLPHLPLLHDTVEIYKCGRRDVCDLQMDPISTICS
nr:PREDICTED: uncharacterized protein LOC109034384 [Bemisia tabaci]